jgi:CelD/BcsL family acetyltransferase involved in cellulose biosynthesis
MPIEILRGDQARDCLRNPDFLSSWDALYQGCGWGTVFQSPAFARVWYSAYEPLYEPLLVYEAGPSGDLAALLPLAVRRETHELAVCGVPNAEYYVWIARDGNEHFFFDALQEVWKMFPQGRLRFMFLPPKTPVTELPPRSIMIPIERPFCALDGNSASESLRKKSNKSRINRLERMGRLEFIQIGSRAELEPHMDRIAEYCDVRQAAVNGSIPFQDDPPKRDFFLMLADEPSVAHYTALTLDGEVIAVHLGFKNRSEVALGLIAHAPSLDRHSPGKLLLLFLIEKLAASGYERFDLTPGGAYKDRFHNGRDEAFRLWAFARQRDCLALRAKFTARRWMKNVDAASGGKLRKLLAK